MERYYFVGASFASERDAKYINVSVVDLKELLRNSVAKVMTSERSAGKGGCRSKPSFTSKQHAVK